MARGRVGIGKLWIRAMRLRCPACGSGKLYRSYFRMNEACETCETKFDREPGYFLGAIYFNYGLTSLLVASIYCTMMLSGLGDQMARIAITLSIALFFPLFFFRYARSLWLALDQYVDPRAEK